MKKAMQFLSLLLVCVFLSSSACRKNQPSNDACNTQFTDPSNNSWIKDKIESFNGTYSDTRKATDRILDLKKVTYFDAHGPVIFYVFKVVITDPLNLDCAASTKEVYNCSGYLEGKYTCGTDPNEAYAHSIGEGANGTDDVQVIWPVN